MAVQSTYKKKPRNVTFNAYFDDANGVLKGSVLVYDRTEGDNAIHKASPNFIIADDGETVETCEVQNAKFRTLRYVTETVSPTAGALELDLSNANVFYLQHSETCTLNLINVPPAGSAVFVSIARIKADTADEIEIDWENSTPTFENTPEALTQTPNAIDKLTLRTVDGGLTWYVSVIFNLVGV